MTKEQYKDQIDNFVQDMIAEGADKDMVLNALTDVTLGYINAALDGHSGLKRRGRAYSGGARG